ncbi:MAG TPA: sulfite exporter TauE/SafE family protein [Solirubrobacteraceae bacterium]|nr:sulfite exporter TauE/SafE family protein [Solirubrobacteraceae bacterium]
MSLLHAVMVFVAGIVAGTINTVVGSGTLFTFPVLLSIGYAPVVANVSNTVGLVPGSVSGAIGYRRELVGQRSRLARLAMASVSGGIAGAVLLLVLPAGAFKAIVPVFIVIALVMILAQPRLAVLRGMGTAHPGARRQHAGALATLGVFAGGVYGGYFGAAQGILVLAILGLSIDDELQRLNAVKVVLTGLVNLVSGLVFVFAAHVAWAPAGLIAAGSVLGGVIGARAGRRLPPAGLRVVIVIVGIVAIVRLLTS